MLVKGVLRRIVDLPEVNLLKCARVTGQSYYCSSANNTSLQNMGILKLPQVSSNKVMFILPVVHLTKIK